MKFIPNSVSRTVARNALKMQKHSPRMLFIAGIAGAVTSTVLACRATLKLEGVVEDVEKDLTGLKLSHGSEHYRKDLVYTYAKGSMQVLRLYAPAIAVGSLSVAALTGSHVTLVRRNASLTAAYAALSKGFDEYRDRVRKELGNEREYDIYHGTIVETTVDEKGKTLITKKHDPNALSVYSRLFDEGNPHWQKDPQLNRLFLQCQQNYANHRLQARGHLFLNEVYEELGFEHTPQGAVCGWVIDPNNPGGGDMYVDFGIFRTDNEPFINGFERSVWLDFNVDGVIWDKI